MTVAPQNEALSSISCAGVRANVSVSEFVPAVVCSNQVSSRQRGSLRERPPPRLSVTNHSFACTTAAQPLTAMLLLLAVAILVTTWLISVVASLIARCISLCCCAVAVLHMLRNSPLELFVKVSENVVRETTVQNRNYQAYAAPLGDSVNTPTSVNAAAEKKAIERATSQASTSNTGVFAEKVIANCAVASGHVCAVFWVLFRRR